MNLIRDLERKGVILSPKLTFKSETPLDAETLALLKAHKGELLRDLTAPDTIPRLPWRLERLLAAAASNNLPEGTVSLEMGLVTDLNRFVLAWVAAYLLGDRQNARQHLGAACRAWEGEKGAN